ncbi:MAG: NAD(P)/FAD-dependent oxidoreductase [Actinobacteria bacterium]|nr:MAG: NAD(P)/FAD-dependent oxidoreductase [Actinomycetota bacterium]
MPSKVLLASASLYRKLGRAHNFGLIADDVGVNFSDLIDRKDLIVEQISGPNLRAYLESQGMEIIEGRASFASEREISVDGRRLSFNKALVATGSRPLVPPIDGLDISGYITSREAIDKRRLPRSVIVMGGSSVALEFTAVYRSFGSSVTIVEAAPRIAFREDAQVSEELARRLAEQGVTIYTNATVRRAAPAGPEKSVIVETSEGEITLQAEELFVATGRRPNVEGLGLEEIGVDFGAKGIKVDPFLRTSARNVYAAGDVIPTLQLAQVGAYEGYVVGANAVSGDTMRTDYRVMPRVTWSYPEMASVGLTEEEATRQGIPHVVGSFPLAPLARAFAESEQSGFVKALVDLRNHEVIGFHAIGERSDEMVHEGLLAMHGRIKLHELAQAVFAEITMSEAVGNLFIELDATLERARRAA